MLFSGVYLLSEDPLIVSCQGAAEIRAALGIPRPADILLHPTWLITAKSLPGFLRFRWLAARKGKTLHFMRNAEQEDRLLRRLRVPGDLVNIASYIDDQAFRITGEAKRYDAVYAARMVGYKRLWLAGSVRSLFVQTYGECRKPDGSYDLHRYEPAISHCDFNRGWVSVDELVASYNRARVGLSLSKVEGAMLASVEYMLCGLPQVSTPCRGGREQFFDTRFVAIVDEEPKAVAAAVQELIDRKIDPDLVRGETLKKLRVHRERLCDYVIRIIERRGKKKAPDRDRLLDRIFGEPGGISARHVHFKRFKKYGFST